MARTRSLRSTGITPLQRYKETDSPPQLDSDDAAMTYERFISLWVGKAGGELLRGSPPLSGASVLSASRLEPLVPFPLASPARFSRSVQEPDCASRRLHAGCRVGSLRTSPR